MHCKFELFQVLFYSFLEKFGIILHLYLSLAKCVCKSHIQQQLSIAVFRIIAARDYKIWDSMAENAI